MVNFLKNLFFKNLDLEKHRLWGDIAAAAESGRDFSARWFTNIGNKAGQMGSTRFC